MITAIVQFPIPEPVSVEQAREVFLQSAPMFQEAAGLVRKQYLLGEDGATMGGVYLWESHDLAERFYDELREVIQQRYGVEPTITFFETPVIVDNSTGEVLAD